MITLRIRQSSARTYRQCKRRYKLSNIDKLTLRDKHPALSIGTACHAGRATWLRTGDAMQSVLAALNSMEAECETYPSLREQKHDPKVCAYRQCYTCAKQVISEVVAGYCTSYPQRFPGGAVKVLGIELPFEVELAQYEDLSMFVQGTIDADIILNEQYRLNFEFKTTKAGLAYYMEQEYMSLQHKTYAFAQWKVTGALPYGTLLDVARKPLKTQGPEFDHQLIPITEDELNEVRRDYEEQLREIAYSLDNEYFPPNFDACYSIKGRCEFAPLCKSRFDPHIARNLYAVVDDNAQTVANSEADEAL